MKKNGVCECMCVCLKRESEQQKQNKRLNKDASNVFLLKIETNT